MTTEERIAASILTARAHILTTTLGGLSAATVTRVLLDPRALQAVAAMNARADAGDLLGTRQAAQTWNRACLAARKEDTP